MPKESDPIRNGIISTVVGAIIFAALTEFWSPIKVGLAWTWVKLTILFSFFTATYAAPGWVLTILGLISLTTLSRKAAALLRRRTKVDAKLLSYTTDNLYGAKWRWSWSGEQISKLWCFCPSCDSELVYDDKSSRDILYPQEPRTDFICEHCGHACITSIKGGNMGFALSAVQREIRRKLRTGQAPMTPRSDA